MVLLQIAGGDKVLVNSGNGDTVTFIKNVVPTQARLDVVEDGTDNFKTPKGRLLMTDPISQRSRALNHTQNVQITPRPKFFVMHPAYVYHTSEPYQGIKDRKFFVFVIRIAEPIQHKKYKTI
jgi:hypothetical protein